MASTHAAVFDVDRTLLPRTTGDRIFLSRLWREGLIGWRQWLAGLQFSAARLGPSLLTDWRAHRPYLAGLEQATIASLARRCFTEEIRPRLAARGLECCQTHRRDGRLIVLLSGSLIELVEPLRDFVGADLAIASRLGTASGRLTGRLASPHPYGPIKASLIRQLAAERSIELAASYCYADHHTDAPLLSLFGYPVCVNPNSRLAAIARQAGWPIDAFL